MNGKDQVVFSADDDRVHALDVQRGEQRGYAEEDFSVIARKYFPEMQLPTVEQDLELFEKPPPIEPAATISSMGEVAAAVQPDVDVAPPPEEPAPKRLRPANLVALEQRFTQPLDGLPERVRAAMWEPAYPKVEAI